VPPVPEFLHKTACLARGACVHWAHEHAASFLIAKACRLAYQDHGWATFYAYSDQQAGEVGTVYQARNWLYLGQGVGRKIKTRNMWRYLPTAERYSTRQLRGRLAAGKWPFNRMRNAKDISALRKNPNWIVEATPDKHKYVHFEGNRKERKIARKLLRYPVLPYPKRVVSE
jgi:hypothetical protein